MNRVTAGPVRVPGSTDSDTTLCFCVVSLLFVVGEMAYSAEQKAIALEFVERNGGEVSGVLDEIRTALGRPALNHATVWRWVQAASFAKQDTVCKSQTEKKAALQQAAAKTLDEMFEEVAQRYLERALSDDVVKKMTGRDLVISAATSFDKMRLARDLPTEIISVLPQVMRAIEARGLSAGDVFDAMLAELVSSDSDGG